MNPSEFIAKWRDVALTERSASQQHFLDLCEVLGHPKPVDVDKTGESYTFEKGATKRDGSDGWADVWKKGHFGWEYKGRHKDLTAAYRQLLQYYEALENPPLLVVCDMNLIEVHTHFTSSVEEVHSIPLEELGAPRSLEILRALFNEPEKLRPGRTSEAITTEAAQHLAEIAQSLRERGLDPHEVAHFLDRVVFCLFAEDIGLLPKDLFTTIVAKSNDDPPRFAKLVGQLFEAMAEGGDFGTDEILHFNGSLFVKGPVLEMTVDEIAKVHEAAKLDWSAVDPSIFGTLFERGMDPSKRSQLGAHYTSREDIETLVEPVVMKPLRREWEKIAAGIDKSLSGKRTRSKVGTAKKKVLGFHDRLAKVKVLDPACGSGNFLYVTLQKLKDFEKEILHFALRHGLGGFLPKVHPLQLYGIEKSPYAFDLAQMVVWIGFLQWNRANGFGRPRDPVLDPMDRNFLCKDAIIDLSDPENPKEPEWPKVDFIVGNPPFLGDKMMRGELGDEYTEALRALYHGRVPGGADLCCYWFEKARSQIKRKRCLRAGLLATQGIRGGANRKVLERIKESGDIFFAESDRPWILDGANVHVSMVGWDSGEDHERVLDGKLVPTINANLSATADMTIAARLPLNSGRAFLGSCKGGSFDLAEGEALPLLHLGGNPHGKPNSDVLRPVANSRDLLQRSSDRWIIDNRDLELEKASLYQDPHALVVERVKPHRDKNRNTWLRDNWWRPQRMRPEMRKSIEPLGRFAVTPTTSKHRLFVWLEAPILPDHQLIVFSRADDYFLGVLHSRLHEVWARAQGTQLRERESGFRYTPTSCFETFPLPEEGRNAEAISAAAKELDDLRSRWLNPPEWTKEEVLEFPGSKDGPWARYVHDPDTQGIGTVRYPRTVAKDEDCAKKLKKRTLTNLYNERPTWLGLAHRKLDEAVFAAYRWRPEISDEEILEKLLELNLARSTP